MQFQNKFGRIPMFLRMMEGVGAVADCLFCKIIAGEIPGDFVYEDEQMVVFRDKFPKASVHLLAVPRKHIASLDALTAEDATLMGHLTLKLKDIAQAVGLEEGYRTIVNTGAGGGQEIFHIHYHILGGDKLPGF